MYFLTSHLWPAGCSTVHTVSAKLQPLMALHSKHACCRYDDGTCSRGAVPSLSPDTDTLNGNGKCDWGQHLNYCEQLHWKKIKIQRSNVCVIGGNRSEVLLVLTKTSWLEGMTTHFQTDESAKGPRSKCFVLFSGYSTFHTHFRTMMQTFAFLSLSCREPRNNCWIPPGRSPPLWKKWAAAFRPLPIKVADKCFCLFFAAQRPQQRQRKHPWRSHDPQETPQLDRRPRRQLLPRHPGDQVSKGDPFLTSDWLIVWASVKRRRWTRGRELRVWELTESYL